tara:strand:+ start:147 stop:425 length:279 start_codon:yes stop_codon:yes gene_type:complete
MNDYDDDYIVSLDSFNNKGNKGDDDFETWLANEAPLVSNTTYGTTVDLSDLTFGNTSASKTKLQYSMPIDVLYKWYPKEMKKDEEFNDDIPF